MSIKISPMPQLPIVDFLNASETINGNVSSDIGFSNLLYKRANAMLSWMQPGLIYSAPFQQAISVFNIDKKCSLAYFAKLLSDMRQSIHDNYGNDHCSVSMAFSFPVWANFCNQNGRSLPKGMKFEEFEGGNEFEPSIINRSNGTLQNSRADVWLIIKADSEKTVLDVALVLCKKLNKMGITGDNIYCVPMQSRTNPILPKGGTKGRVLGGRFQENLRNPVSPVEILEHVLVGGEDPTCFGGTFIFTQQFYLNWAELHSKTISEIESTIGRQQYTDEFVPSFDARSHVRSSHTYDTNGNTIKLLRIGLPFGSREQSDNGTPLIQNAGGSSLSDEKGIYFIGMARSATRIETILRSQFGQKDVDKFTKDRLLGSSITRSELGGFFYAPSLAEINAPAFAEDLCNRSKSVFNDWTQFPGVDWSRLSRHYDNRSKNGWLFYNHKDYLYTIGTRDPKELGGPGIISLRVQFLLERIFSKWDDTWFRAQTPNDLAALPKQLNIFLSKSQNAPELSEILKEANNPNGTIDVAVAYLMKQPVNIRAAWASRLLCNLASRSEIGHRGNGGMDTCNIHPLDLLAGSVPAQSLAEGKYVIDYTSEDIEEKGSYNWFNKALGPTSGVGHVVPGYERILNLGISGIEDEIEKAESRLSKADKGLSNSSEIFYKGLRLALKGITEYLAGLAETVNSKLAEFTASGQDIERESLKNLETRLRWLAEGNPPRTVLEALQLILTCHITLHLCGEPVAVGRIDKLLRPFQEKEQLSLVQLQEAIDCFWLKLAEKVLLNRLFIDDRQQLGNLAMGNSSGPYPKGQSVNQWIQQVTVGGKNLDGSWEYSEVTLACLRASSRLPFNAPVLSLRVSNEMPEEWRKLLLCEAAKGQLSGGASPIILNDDKIIPSLAKSGDNIGPKSNKKEAKLWNSKVRIEDAHNYACDGCYEPQFVGNNWFCLGGFPLLQMLEYALNQGRKISSAGPVHLFGTNNSFRSHHSSEILKYEELEDIFIKHTKWNFAKQMEEYVKNFGNMAEVCPGPLISIFIDDCIAKGQDIYYGGARYNVFGPCFTSLANTINSLWAIRTMCFDKATAVVSLPELVQALLSNWGENLIDPLVHPAILANDSTRTGEEIRRFRQLRKIALSLPRWGRGNPEIDAFGNEICAKVSITAVEVMTKPTDSLADLYETVAKKFGTLSKPFGGFSMQPGVGTFASYVEAGLGCSASADGRLNAQPIGTDMSPSPSPIDFPATIATQQRVDAISALKGLRSTDAFGFANGAPIDLNIDEDTKEGRLVEILDAFVSGAGSNILTVTVANQDTFLSATNSPEAYDLLRVRMGGWTEMFVAMHAAHQKVHPRRPYST